MTPRLRNAAAALALLSAEASAQELPTTTKCESAPLMVAWTEFGEKGKVAQFIKFGELQKIEPYKAFDNVYYVGRCWVSAWLLTSPQGHVLIDTLYDQYTDQILANIRALGLDPKSIKLVVITHGHLDHAGGAARLKSVLEPGTRFAMTKEGWREAAEAAALSAARPKPWTMIEPDIVLTDGQMVTGGEIAIQAFETPGHTMGTASFAFDARDGARTFARSRGWAWSKCHSRAGPSGSVHCQFKAHPHPHAGWRAPRGAAPYNTWLFDRSHRSKGSAENA